MMKVERIKDLARGERIKYVRAEVMKLTSQEAMAKALAAAGLQVTRGAVGNWELGGEISLDSMQAISAVSGVNIDWIATGKGGEPAQAANENAPASMDSPNAIVRGKVEGEGVKVPLYGRAVGGVDGEFEMNGSLLGHVMVPPKLAGVKGVYAVQIAGDSMSPRYDDGETCIIDPTYRVKKGDYVVAQVQLVEDGPLLAYVKRFCRRNDIELILEQLNPPKELQFPAKNVVSVHYISVAGHF